MSGVVAHVAEARPALPAVSSHPVLLWLLGAVMVAGAFVSAEPAPFDIAILLLGAAGLLLGALAFTPVNRWTVLLLAGYLAVNVASLAAAHDMAVAQKYLVTTAYLAASFLAFVGFLNRYGAAGWNAVLGGYAVSGVISAVASALTYWHVLPLDGQVMMFGRVKGWFKDPNVFGPYLVIVFLFAVVRLERPGARLARLLPWMVALAAASVGIFIVFSRGAWINLGVSLAVYFGIRLATVFRTGMIGRRLGRVMVSVAVGLACIGLAVLSDPGTRRMLTIRMGDGGLQEYDQVRFYTHQRALEAGMKNPLGIGPGQSEVEFAYATHSMYLRVFGENGLPGLLLFYAMVLGGFARAGLKALRSPQPAAAELYALACAAMAGILVNGLAIDVVHWRHFWLASALTWSRAE